MESGNNGSNLPTSGSRPPTPSGTGARTRAQTNAAASGSSGMLPSPIPGGPSPAASASPGGDGQQPLLDTVNPTIREASVVGMEDLSLALTTALTAFAREWSQSTASSAQTLAGASASSAPVPSQHSASASATKREGDKVLISRIPDQANYDNWRDRVINATVAASVNPKATLVYLQEVGSEHDLSSTPEEFENIDAKLKSALLNAMDANTESNNRILARYRNDVTVNGRTLLRYIDADFGRRTNQLNAQRVAKLTQLTCKGYSDLSNFLSAWVNLTGAVAGSPQDLDETTKKVFLQQKLEKIQEVSAILAKYDASESSYRDLLDSLLQKEAMTRVWKAERVPEDGAPTRNMASPRIAPGFAKIAKPSNEFANPCQYCVGNNKDQKYHVRHTSDNCWHNPRSPSFGKGPKPKMNNSKKFRDVSAYGSRMGSSDKALAARVARDPAILREALQHLPLPGGLDMNGSITKGKAAIITARPHATVSQVITIDSGASHSITSLRRPFGNVISECDLERPVALECIGRTVVAEKEVQMEDASLGRINALVIEDAPPVVSLGQLISEGYRFAWDPEYFGSPSLVHPNGTRVDLQVENNTPILSRRAMATNRLKAHVAVHHDHSVLHYPTDSNCALCQVSKMKKRPARRVPMTKRHVAKSVWEKVSIDLVESTFADIHENFYIFTLRDDFSGFFFARPQKSKSAVDSLQSFQEIIQDAGIGVPKIIRSDQGGEFEREFASWTRTMGITREYGIPYRPTSDGRHERVHLEMNQAIRALLLQAGLPKTYWSYAVKYWETVYNHLQNAKHTQLRNDKKEAAGDEFPMNPCEMKNHGHPCKCYDKIFQVFGEWPLFGAQAFYLNTDNMPGGSKFESRARPGVVLGIASPSSILVGDVATIARDRGLQTIETRDVKINNTVFPARALGMRPESDVIFYTLLDATERQEMQLCLGCGQPKLQTPPTCPKCVDPTINQPHDRDHTCFLGSCRCKHKRTNYQSFWFLYPEEPEEELLSSADHDIFTMDTVGTVVDVKYPARNETDTSDDVEDNPLVQFQQLPSPPDSSLPMFAITPGNSFETNDFSTNAFSNGGQTMDMEISTEESLVSEQHEGNELQTRNTHGMRLYLTKAIPVSEAAGVAEGVAAIKKEVETMKRYGVWNEKEVMEKEIASKAHPDAQFVKVKLITAIKNAELETGKQKYKARLVAQGCAMRNIHGYITKDLDYPYEAPSNLASLRLALWYASRNNNDVAIADVEGAYLHATLGGPPTFLILPIEVRPKSWENMENPVVRAKKAIYGLSRSGSDFAVHANAILGEYGWIRTTADMSLYFKNGMLLLIYVDDIMIVGPRERLPEELEKLKDGFGINSFQTLGGSSPTPGFKYLGIDIFKTPTHIELSMENYTRKVLDDYCIAVGQPILRKAKSPGWTDVSSVEEATVPGSLSARAAEFVGKLLWLSRTTRPDITFAVHYLSGMVSKWSAHADRALGRVMQYLFHHPGLGITFEQKPGVPTDQVRIITYVDADHAGQTLSTRSTSGYAIYLEDGNARDLVDWSSKRQSTTALSTAEAELMAMTHGLKATLAYESFFEEALGATAQVDSLVLCDNQTAIQAVENGYSIRMRHLSKAHRVHLGFIHEVMGCKRRKLQHVPTAENIADIFTKSLSPEPFHNIRNLITVKLEAREIP